MEMIRLKTEANFYTNKMHVDYIYKFKSSQDKDSLLTKDVP